jgi:hypothetical protein
MFETFLRGKEVAKRAHFPVVVNEPFAALADGDVLDVVKKVAKILEVFVVTRAFVNFKTRDKELFFGLVAVKPCGVCIVLQTL